MNLTTDLLDERIAGITAELEGLNRRADDLALEHLSQRSAAGPQMHHEIAVDLRELTARIAGKTGELELFNRARRAAARQKGA